MKIAAAEHLAFVGTAPGRTSMKAIELRRSAPDVESEAWSGSRALTCLAAAVVCVLCGLACHSAPAVEPPLATPPIELSVHYHAGTALGGALASPSPEPIDETPEQALVVKCRLVYFDRYRPEALSSLLESARLVVSDRGNQPLISYSARELGVRVAAGPSALEFVHQLDSGGFDRTVIAGEIGGALPQGVTLAVSYHGSGAASTGSERAVSTSVEAAPLSPILMLTRGTGEQAMTITALLSIEDSSAIEDSVSARARRRGVLLAESPQVDGAPLVVVIPPSSSPASTAPLAIVVEVSSPPAITAAAHAQALERCASDVARERTAAEQSGRKLPPEEAYATEMVCALQALEIARYHRAALSFMARSSGAELAESLALVADVEALESYVADALMACGGAQSLARASPALGWKLEATAYLFLANMSLREALPPELLALLVRHAGEAGRYPDELQGAIDSCRDTAALQGRFLAQNRDALQDDRPASRVRAFDWLSVRGLAPEGYDPLGSERERHAALLRVEAALQAAQRQAADAGAEKPR
jgi:hypothetical protein